MPSLPFRRRLLPVCGVIVAAAVIWTWTQARSANPGSKATATSTATMAGARANAGASSGAPASAAPAPRSTREELTIPARGTFAAACARLQIAPQLVHRLVEVAKPVFNLGRIQAGNTLTLVRAATGEVQALSYRIDDNHWLRLQVQPVEAAGLPASAPAGAAPAAGEHWTATVQTVPYETRLAGFSGTVDTSLAQAVDDSGANDQLAVEMAQIFRWDLDFNTDPRQGDVFRVLVEEKYLNGKFSRFGQIVAAEYVNAGHKYEAVRFHDAEGVLAYYTPDGKPLKREFLRSPFKYLALRVTSPFTRRRYHPILHIYRAHLGVDYGAPKGTPVQAIGSGVVVWAARKGEDGNMVELRHANGYETYYLHLSRILVHRGEHVAQGERIGLVGMTGLATGPHLDFRIEHNGRFENFQKLRQTLPPAAPVSAKLMPKFQQITAEFLPRLAQLQPAPATTTESAASDPSSDGVDDSGGSPETAPAP